jgi:hypothetical protein
MWIPRSCRRYLGHKINQHIVWDREALIGILEGLSVTRIFLLIVVALELLTGCSASSRVEHIVPSWANTPLPREAMPQQQDRREPRSSKVEIKPQEHSAPAPQSAVLDE